MRDSGRTASHEGAAFRSDDELDVAAGGLIAASQLHQRAEQVLKRDCLRATGDEPFGPAVEASFRSIAFQRRDRQLRRRMAVSAQHSDRSQVAQIEMQQRFAHSAPFTLRSMTDLPWKGSFIEVVPRIIAGPSSGVLARSSTAAS
jgi:hypothetical protein